MTDKHDQAGVISKLGLFAKDSFQCISSNVYNGIFIDRIGVLLTFVFDGLLKSVQNVGGVLLFGVFACLNFLLIKLIQFIESV